MRKTLPVLLILLLAGCFSHAQSNRTVNIYGTIQQGDSIHKVITALQNELNKSYPAKYIVAPLTGNDKQGIFIATTAQAISSKIAMPASLKAMGAEGFSITGTTRSVTIIGNTALALREAIYTYLEQLGYRWLMPGDDWKIVPAAIVSPYQKISILTQPSYEYRWIANGHGYMNSQKIATDFNDWAIANRLGGAFDIKVGHAYDEIVNRNLQTFKDHPEYFAEAPAKGTIPTEFKFNISNKNLVDLVVNDAFGRYELQQRIKDFAPMISMEPSDGGGFRKGDNPSEQVYALTNTVAKALQKKYPGVWAGQYAYNEHILPPKFALEPNVFIMITNGFNRSKYSTEELLQMWGKRVKKIGVYEYLSVYEWDNDLPGQVTVAKIDYLKKSVKKFYNYGARSYQGESVMGWVSRGPGQYILSRLLWNINVDVDSVRNDFFQKGYGPAASLISKLYKQWENYPHRIASDNDMADWLALVNTAYDMSTSDIIKKRIDYIKAYLVYVLKYRIVKKNPSEENMIDILNYAYRTFEQTAFATLPTMVSLPGYTGYKGWGWYDNPTQKWKNDKRPYTKAELDQNFQLGVRSNKKVEGLSAFIKSDEMIKLGTIVNIPVKKYAGTPHALWDITEYVFQINNQSANNFIEINSGFSAQPAVDRGVEINIYPLKKGATADDDIPPVLSFNQTAKDIKEKFSMASLKPGQYRMRINDQRKMFVMKFSDGIDYSLVANADYKMNSTSAAGLNTFYFYVPKGTKKFQVVKSIVLQLISPTGRKIDKQDNRDETFTVDVQQGEEGIWTIAYQAGSLYLEGVPPYLGDDPLRMLVPAYLKK